MIACERPPAPAWLIEREPAWTQRWLARREAGQAFVWPKLGSERINLGLLRDGLAAMTAGHCAYCDFWNLPPTGHETVDHFIPKSTAPELAFRWENLFLACGRCQSEKGEVAEPLALRPDGQGYRFERYFSIDFATGELSPNVGADPSDQERARRTIAWFGLNLHGRPGARLRSLRLEIDELPNERSYRFMF